MKKIISTILAVMMLTSVFAGISVSAEVISAPAVHMQEKVVYHETFEDFETNPNPDFEINSWFPVTYEERGDGNGKALVMSATEAGASEEYKGGWVRFLHNAAGDRKLTLHEYLDDSDITEISVDLYSDTERNQSINIATTGWSWQHSLDISENGYVFYPDWELVNNTRKLNWENGEEKDIQKISKAYTESEGNYMDGWVADYEAGKWHTFKFVYDKRSSTISTYIDDTLIGRRVNLSTWKPLALLTIEDQDTAEPNELFFKIDNFKIVQKNYAPIETTYAEDFDTTGTTSFDTSKHTASWWAQYPSVVATGDEEHGNAISLNVSSQGSREIWTDDEFDVRFLANGNKIHEQGYMNADLSVLEADFKVPAKRRMAIELITSNWQHHSVIISDKDWACFVGNQGRPSDKKTNAHKWPANTKKQMLTNNADIATGHIAGFPLFYGSSLNETWHHIRFVRDKVNKTLTAYLDDVCLGTRAFDVEPMALAFSSQTNGVAVGAQEMLVDNIRIGSIADSTAPALSITDTEGKLYNDLVYDDYINLDDIDSLSVYSNGAIVAVPEFAPKTGMSVAMSLNKTVADIRLSSVVTGEITAKYDDGIDIDGKTYTIDETYRETLFNEITLGNKYTFTVDFLGNISYAKFAETRRMTLGYIINVAEVSGAFDSKTKIKLISADGSKLDLECAEDIIIDAVKYEDESADKLINVLKNGKVHARQLIQYELNSDGKLKEIDTVKKNPGEDPKYSLQPAFDEVKSRWYHLGRYGLTAICTNDSVAFCIPKDGSTDEKHYYVGKGATSITDSNDCYWALDCYYAGEDSGYVDAIIGEMDINEYIPKTVIMYDKCTEALDSDGDYVYKMSGYFMGAVREYTLEEDVIGVDQIGKFNRGDLIVIQENQAGDVSVIEKVFDAKTKQPVNWKYETDKEILYVDGFKEHYCEELNLSFGYVRKNFGDVISMSKTPTSEISERLQTNKRLNMLYDAETETIQLVTGDKIVDYETAGESCMRVVHYMWYEEGRGVYLYN